MRVKTTAGLKSGATDRKPAKAGSRATFPHRTSSPLTGEDRWFDTLTTGVRVRTPITTSRAEGADGTSAPLNGDH